MPLVTKNCIPTRFSIDLTSIDLKIEKLAKYFTNCHIDLKDDGKRFINSQVDYSSLQQSLRNKKYKESLARLVDKIYTDRFNKTKANLVQNGILSFTDLIIPGALDDFGSKFDAFAATNTDPSNVILQILNVQPYRELIVDIFSKEDYEIYQKNINSYYDVERLSYILQKLNNITLSYVDPLTDFVTTGKFIDELNKEILNIKPAAPPAPGESVESNEFNLLQTVPNIQNAVSMFSLLTLAGINSQQYSNKLFSDTLKIVEPNFKSLEDINKISNLSVLEKAKIKVLSFIIANEIKAVLENTTYKVSNLNSFRSRYGEYNFYEQKFVGSEVQTPKENLIFKLTFLRNSLLEIQKTNQDNLLDNIIEFNAITSLNITSPFGNSKIKNDKFVAIITGTDLSLSPTPVEFFEPTILAMLSDLNYIDANIFDINPTYCPPQQILNPQVQSNANSYVRNEVLIDTVIKNKELVDSNPNAFNYYNFPDIYFIPNILAGPDAFYESFEQKILSSTKAKEIIKNYSKYYYNSYTETPAGIISRDSNLSRLFENTAAKNGFYGFTQIKQDSFADPFAIQQIIDKLNNLTANTTSEIQSIVLAKTNIACLLKEFQTCFLPKIGNCKDTLRGFRFGDLEQFVSKAFPESIYPAIYEIINNYKQTSIRDAREKLLLDEIKIYEEAIKNNPRKAYVFSKLDSKIEPAAAFNMADNEIRISKNTNLEQEYKNKLQEYKEFKLNQEQLPDYAQQEQLKVDQFLDLLEENGIDIEVLCDLAKIISDLTKISFTFGSITLPEFPSIDLFQETKLSIDLSIAEIILQTFIAFIKKILEELLSCNGLKDLIKGALTGQAEGLTGAAAAAIGQLATGKFDLEEFVKNNPQVDPNSYNESFTKLADSLSKTLSYSSTSAANINIDLGYAGQINAAALQTKNLILSNPNSSAVTEKQIAIALNGLISELVVILPPEEFINLAGGKPLNSTLLKVVGHILTNRPDIAYLGNVMVIKNLFKSISEISGLDTVRSELLSVANLYSSAGIKLTDKFCLDDIGTSFGGISIDQSSQDVSEQQSEMQQRSIDRQKYRDLIQNLLSCSPENIKLLVDDNVFKPILMGLLPNGSVVPSINSSNKKAIKRSLNKIDSKFKNRANEFYSKLALKKKEIRTVEKTIPGKGEEPGSYENPEFNDLVNKGGYIKKDNKVYTKDGGEEIDSITVEEEKVIYGGLFTENFSNLSSNLSISTDGSSTTLLLNGEKSYSSKILQDYFSNNSIILNKWKLENIIKNNENTLNLYEGTSLDSQLIKRFSFKRKIDFTDSNIDNFIGDIINYSITEQPDNQLIKEYTNKVSIDYLKNIFNSTIEYVNKDGLLKQIDKIESDSVSETIIKNALSNIDIDINKIQENAFTGLNINNIDTPLKYINFGPRPTVEQKSKNVDPSLYGKLEITELIGKILSQRKTEIINLKTLQQMLEDDDNTLTLSIIDGLYMSLIRAICTDAALRALFILRTFKFNKDYFNNLILQTYLSDILFEEIQAFSNEINKKSFLKISQEHIEYLHNFKFKNGLYINGLNLLDECIQLKQEIENLKQDGDILFSYINRINSSQIEANFVDTIKNYINCLKDEIQQKQIKLTKLYLRNLIHSELHINLEKLSFLTSTNEKITNELEPNCRNKEEVFVSLNGFIIDSLVNKITDISWMSDNINIISNIFDIFYQQNFKFNNKICIEHFIKIPIIKNEFTAERQIQISKKLYGICSFSQFNDLINEPQIYSLHKNNINNLFDEDIQYGARIIYIPEDTSEGATLQEYNTNLSFVQNINLHNKKSKIYLSKDTSYDLKMIGISGGINELINLYDKTYSIPYFYNEQQQNKLMLGFRNCFPLITETVNISKDYNTAQQLTDYIKTLENIETNNLIENIKLKFKCNENLQKLNNLFSNNETLFNMLIFSSLNILGGEQIISSFGNVRFSILNDILTNINIVYNKNNNEFLEDLSEILSSSDYFKNFNADLILKTAIKAAIYVLQYYCQMTDPNISLAMVLRNAVKLSFGLASQIPNPFGQTLPSEPPIPLNLLAPYSIAQLPINLFGVPPVGIGVGLPITIPGIVLLGAELLLLNLEFAENIEKNSQNQQIKNKLRELCFDLEGYKKYGVE